MNNLWLIFLLVCFISCNSNQTKVRTISNSLKAKQVPIVNLETISDSLIIDYSTNTTEFYFNEDSLNVDLVAYEEVIAHQNGSYVFFMTHSERDSFFLKKYDLKNKKITKSVNLHSFLKLQEEEDNWRYPYPYCGTAYCLDLAYGYDSFIMILPGSKKETCNSFFELDYENLDIIKAMQTGCYFDPYQGYRLPLALSGEHNIQYFYKDDSDLYTLHSYHRFFQLYKSQIIAIDYLSRGYSEGPYANFKYFKDLKNGHFYALSQDNNQIQFFSCNQEKYDCRNRGVTQLDSLLFLINGRTPKLSKGWDLYLCIYENSIYFMSYQSDIFRIYIDNQQVEVLKLKNFGRIHNFQIVDDGVFLTFTSRKNNSKLYEYQLIPWKTKNKQK